MFPRETSVICSVIRFIITVRALLLAVGFSLLGSFHRFSPSRRLSAALRAHRRFDVLLAVLVPVLPYFFYSPLTLWLCLGFSPLAPWLWLRVCEFLSPLASWLWFCL